MRTISAKKNKKNELFVLTCEQNARKLTPTNEQIVQMQINVTLTPMEYALACLGAALMGKTLNAAFVSATVAVEAPSATGKE